MTETSSSWLRAPAEPPSRPTVTDEEIRDRLEWVEQDAILAFLEQLKEASEAVSATRAARDLYEQVVRVLLRLHVRRCECGWVSPFSFVEERVEAALTEHLDQHEPVAVPSIPWPEKSAR